MSIFSNPGKVLGNILAFFEGPVWNFLKPFAQSLESGGSAILIAAAENAVQAGFAAPGDGSEKMAAALASFSTEVKAKSIPFMESQARTLIEIALQKAKATTTVAAVATESPADVAVS